MFLTSSGREQVGDATIAPVGAKVRSLRTKADLTTLREEREKERIEKIPFVIHGRAMILFVGLFGITNGLRWSKDKR